MSHIELQQNINKVLIDSDLKNHVNKISLFGSFLTGKNNEKSDVDLLIEFNPSAEITFFELVRLEELISQKIKRPVDLVTPDSLSKFFRSDVINNAKLIYERR